jgi:aspartate kinase
MIVQNVSQKRKTDISFTINKADQQKAIKLIKEVADDLSAGEVVVDDDIARISIVGVGMKSHHGVAATMFETLAKHNINIEMISTSDISISCIIDKDKGEDAVKALHEKFGLDKR